MNFGFNIFQSAESYVVKVYEGNVCVERQQISALPIMAQQQFMSLCEQVKSMGRPMKVRMVKYSYVQGRPDPIEEYIEYKTWED